MHADEMNLKSVNGHAIATIEVPAHRREVEIAYSAIEGCAIAAVEAWNTVRGEGDARFEVCDPSYRSTLMAHAESVYGGAAPLAGDTALALFEAEVARIRAEQIRDTEAAFAAAHPEPIFGRGLQDAVEIQRQHNLIEAEHFHKEIPVADSEPDGPKIGVLESEITVDDEQKIA